MRVAADDSPRRSDWRRPAVLAVIVVALAVGAFLLWGPIGVGNGPLDAGVGDTQGWGGAGPGLGRFIIPIHNSGRTPAVIDGVDLIGGTRYAGPRVLSLRVLTSGRCGGAQPARQTARGFVLAGCGGTDSGPLIGHGFGFTQAKAFGLPAAAEVAVPGPGTCWLMTKIVVHYHVGIRHYSASDPYRLAVCAGSALVNSAMAAAGAAS